MKVVEGAPTGIAGREFLHGFTLKSEPSDDRFRIFLCPKKEGAFDSHPCLQRVCGILLSNEEDGGFRVDGGESIDEKLAEVSAGILVREGQCLRDQPDQVLFTERGDEFFKLEMLESSETIGFGFGFLDCFKADPTS